MGINVFGDESLDVPAVSQREHHERLLFGGSISLIGLVLLGVPLYDIWDDLKYLDWRIVFTLVENALVLALAGGLVAGGGWLVYSDWRTEHVRTVAVRTVAGTVGVAALIGWIVYIQLWAMHALKPYVIAMDSILIGAITTFGIAVYSTKSGVTQRELSRERAAGERLKSLHEFATRLHDTTDTSEACTVSLDGIGEMLSPGVARIVVDGEVYARTFDTLSFDGTEDPDLTTPIGDRGRIELVRGPFAAHERKVIELLGTHLDRAFDRIDREKELKEEHDRLEFINRTVRHNLLNDINTIQARLQLIETDDTTFAEQRDVIVPRIEDMAEFIAAMRSYVQTLVDDPDLQPLSLRSTLLDKVEITRKSYPNAAITVGDVPDVDVPADDLLGPVFENLLTNAVEHNTRSTPEVDVDVDRDEDRVTVCIADNGPGIPDDRKEEIFAHGERGVESAGTGFGLYLVQDAVDTYGGSVEVRDNEPEGSVFVVTLPIAS